MGRPVGCNVFNYVTRDLFRIQKDTDGRIETDFRVMDVFSRFGTTAPVVTGFKLGFRPKPSSKPSYKTRFKLGFIKPGLKPSIKI